MKAGGIGIKPKARDEALRCVEIIELFERQENTLGMRAMSLNEPPDFDAIEIEGVMVSIQPDFLVHGSGGRVGAAMLRVAKAPDPAACKTEEAKIGAATRAVRWPAISLPKCSFSWRLRAGSLGTTDRDLCFVADVRLGERIGPAADHAVRARDIRGACRQIAGLWAGIQARPSLWNK